MYLSKHSCLWFELQLQDTIPLSEMNYFLAEMNHFLKALAAISLRWYIPSKPIFETAS
jgi:hypothetical protein